MYSGSAQWWTSSEREKAWAVRSRLYNIRPDDPLLNTLLLGRWKQKTTRTTCTEVDCDVLKTTKEQWWWARTERKFWRGCWLAPTILAVHSINRGGEELHWNDAKFSEHANVVCELLNDDDDVDIPTDTLLCQRTWHNYHGASLENIIAMFYCRRCVSTIKTSMQNTSGLLIEWSEAALYVLLLCRRVEKCCETTQWWCWQ